MEACPAYAQGRRCAILLTLDIQHRQVDCEGNAPMYMMYIDESGDCGIEGSPSRYFVLTGLVVHELRWQDTLNSLVEFRRRLKETHGLRLREELHAARLITRPGELIRIGRHDRLAIIRGFADTLASLADLSLVNIVVDKLGKRPDCDIFALAWRALIQRFHNTLTNRNFSGPANADDRGMLFPDHTDDKKLMLLLRQMRHYNPVPHQLAYGTGYRNLAMTHVVEDPNFRDSAHSYFIQAADMVAYLVYQSFAPNGFMRKKGGHNYYQRLEPIYCKVASPRHPMGFVLL